MTMWADVRAALRLVSKRDRRILILLTAVQASLALMDLVAVLLVGLVALIAAGAATGEVPPLVDTLISRFGASDIDIYALAIGMAVVVALLMIAKSVLSFATTHRAFTFLANRQVILSRNLARMLLTRPLIEVQRRSSQELGHAFTYGINAIIFGILGQSVILVSEVALLSILAIGLMAVDPVVTVFTVLFFSAIGFGLHRIIAGMAMRLGSKTSDTQIESFEAVQEVLRTYREIWVLGRRVFFVERFRDLRWEAARVQSGLLILAQVSKYVFEVALVIGGGLLVASQLLTRDVPAAVAVIAVFLAAASRVVPSLLRLQSAAMTIRSQAGVAEETFVLANELLVDGDGAEFDSPGGAEVRERLLDGMNIGFRDFVAEVELIDVCVSYPGAQSYAVDNITLHVPTASSLAIVGATGAGKSTIADVILGVLVPDAGTAMISGVGPAEAVRRWPGAIAYMPQDISVINADIRRNVALGLPDDLVDEDRVWEALERSHLAEFLRDQRDQLDTIVGEHGVRLSGGQRQRLGLARALYTRPRLLVLDEATSALDAETEATIGQSIADLSGDVTVIIIAHRLATVRTSDQVAYIEAGRIDALGTFDEVRRATPALDRQARLLGL